MLPLTLAPDEMRRIGYRVVDILVNHFVDVSEKPVTRRVGRSSLDARLREPIPRAPSDPVALLDGVERDVFSAIMHLDHPRFFAFVPSPSNFVSVMADALASGFNVFAGTWLEASAPTAIELVTLDWLRGVIGLRSRRGASSSAGAQWRTSPRLRQRGVHA
jgi:glutamate/tyrosine decarboxylase-like PLP-dependent enzyme